MAFRTKEGARRAIVLLPVLGLIFLGIPSLAGAAWAVPAPVPAAGVTIVSLTPAGTAYADGSSTQFSVVAKAVNAQDDPVLGAELDLAVTAGPNADAAGNGAQADATCITAVNGQCTLTVTPLVTSETPGVDQITVWADNNADNLLSNAEASATTTLVWYGPPFSLTIAPTSDTASTGTCIAFAVTVKDHDGNPIPGTKVMVAQTLATATLTLGCDPKLGGGGTSGASPYQAQTPDKTDEDGVLTFAVSSNKVGSEGIEAYCPVVLATGSCGTGDVSPGMPQAHATVTWSDGSGPNVVTTLAVVPSSGKGQGAGTAAFTLTATNAASDPVPGIGVSYQVTAGPNKGAMHQNACTTGNDGTCKISYVSVVATGTDTVAFWVTRAAAARAHRAPTRRSHRPRPLGSGRCLQPMPRSRSRARATGRRTRRRTARSRPIRALMPSRSRSSTARSRRSRSRTSGSTSPRLRSPAR